MQLRSVIKKTLLVFLSALTCHAFSQDRMSPQLNHKAFRFEADKTTLSISVIDPDSFQKKYVNRITLLRKQNESNCFLIRLQKRTLLEELNNDPNVIFVDYHQTPREESVQQYANWNFNRITKLRHFFPELNGDNQNVSVKELAFDPLDIHGITTCNLHDYPDCWCRKFIRSFKRGGTQGAFHIFRFQ